MGARSQAFPFVAEHGFFGFSHGFSFSAGRASEPAGCSPRGLVRRFEKSLRQVFSVPSACAPNPSGVAAALGTGDPGSSDVTVFTPHTIITECVASQTPRWPRPPIFIREGAPPLRPVPSFTFKFLYALLVSLASALLTFSSAPALPTSFPFSGERGMAYWSQSTVRTRDLEALVARGSLPPRTKAMEWIVPKKERRPEPPSDYVVSFVAFHERGFGVPAGAFLRGTLERVKLELQHLNPNGIQQMAAFEALCEGYLHCEAHADLFAHLFSFSLQRDPDGHPAAIGCAALKAKTGRGGYYLVGNLSSSNKGWHSGWFYLRNDAARPLPQYTGRTFDSAPQDWKWGASKTDRKNLDAALAALEAVKARGVDLAEVIGAYLLRGVVPLQLRTLKLYQMTEERAPFTGTVTANPLPTVDEVRRRLRTIMGNSSLEFPRQGVLPMLPDPGTVELVRAFPFRPRFSLFDFFLNPHAFSDPLFPFRGSYHKDLCIPGDTS